MNPKIQKTIESHEKALQKIRLQFEHAAEIRNRIPEAENGAAALSLSAEAKGLEFECHRAEIAAWEKYLEAIPKLKEFLQADIEDALSRQNEAKESRVAGMAALGIVVRPGFLAGSAHSESEKSVAAELKHLKDWRFRPELNPNEAEKNMESCRGKLALFCGQL